MADKKENDQICSSCDTNQASTHWCSECNQSFCHSCKEFHSRVKALQNHVMVPIENYLSLSESFTLPKSTCGAHSEQLQLFCSFHDNSLCLQCIEEHSDCKTLIPISKMIEGIKESETVREVQQGLSDAKFNANVIEKTLTEFKTDVKDQTTSLIAKVKLMRQNINAHLDRLEQNLSDDIIGECQNLNPAFSKSLDDVLGQKTATEKLGRKLEALLKNGSELQVFFGLREVTSELSEIENKILELAENKLLNKPTMKLCIGSEISRLTNINQFGSVTIENESHTVPLKSSKAKQAQLVDVVPRSITDIGVKQVRVIETGGVDVTGCIVLPNDQIAITCYSKNCLIILSKEGKHLGNMTLQPYSSPYGLANIEDDKVAVACYQNIVIVDVKSRKILKAIQVENQSYGVVYVDKKLVCSVSYTNLKVIDPESNVISEIPNTVSRLYACYLATLKNKLYVTNCINESVSCIKMNGEVLWKFKDTSILKSPWGLSVDCYGNVYVACEHYHHVLVLSANGQKSRILISSKVVPNPLGVFVDNDRKQLLVANRQNEAYLFDFILK